MLQGANAFSVNHQPQILAPRYSSYHNSYLHPVEEYCEENVFPTQLQLGMQEQPLVVAPQSPQPPLFEQGNMESPPMAQFEDQ
jgi:hypothetical protein